MKLYKLAISGYVEVEVEADTEAEALDKALEETVAGELYNYELDSAEVIEN